MMQAIIFDLDGTLWDSVIPVVDAWNRILERDYPGLRPPITYDEERALMGKSMDALGRALFPTLKDAEMWRVLDACCEEENRFLAAHGATLYPALAQTLAALQTRFRLMIVSNCQKGYIEAFLSGCHMEPYFCDFQCFGDNQLTKGENIRFVMARNGIENAAYVGDTQGDCDASRQAGVPFIFARYGFGTVDSCDAAIDTPAELLRLELLN